jgi:glucose-6-phosphate dehydrogenase assembly protein OpcA
MSDGPDAVWSERATTPDAIEGALRDLVRRRHHEDGGYVPARVLNMIAFVERRFAGEISNRLRTVGRYHASRTIVFSYEPSQPTLDARAIVSIEREPSQGEVGLLRETVTVQIGEQHLDDLLTIADPLVVTDLATLVWSPHGHPEAVDALLGLAQAVLVDSVDEPSWRDAIRRSCELQRRAYVVDLAWLRSTPWRERLASTFDPPQMRSELSRIDALSIQHHPESTVAAMLLAGWLGSRLGWEHHPLSARERPREASSGARAPDRRDKSSPGATLRLDARALEGSARAQGGEVRIRLEQAPEQQVRGLRSVALSTSSGRRLGLRRSDGGLRARARDPQGHEHEWTILGASRGEGGILGEGIRQALLRDPTYVPALRAVEAMAP